MGGQPGAGADIAGQGRPAGIAAEIHDVGPVPYGQMGGRPGGVAQTFQNRLGDFRQFQRAEIFKAEPEHGGTQPVAILPPVAEQEPHGFQSMQEPEHGRARQIERAGQIARMMDRMFPRKTPQQCQAPLKSGHHVAVLVAGVAGVARVAHPCPARNPPRISLNRAGFST